MVTRIDGDGYVFTKMNVSQLKQLEKQQEEISRQIKENNKAQQTKNENQDGYEEIKVGEIIDEPIDPIKNMNVKRLYNVDDELNWVITSVMKIDTNELVRQIPPQVYIDIAKYLREATANEGDGEINIKA